MSKQKKQRHKPYKILQFDIIFEKGEVKLSEVSARIGRIGRKLTKEEAREAAKIMADYFESITAKPKSK
jgi:aspartate aminotransferase-like enzyme